MVLWTKLKRRQDLNWWEGGPFASRAFNWTKLIFDSSVEGPVITHP